MSPADRFYEKVEKTSFCWLWRGFIMPNGYGQFSIGRRHIYAHRFAYEMAHGNIPEGLTIDHLCRVRNCVNPLHLEAVTQRVNNLRGNSASAMAARATHCPQGHPYAGTNLHVRSEGGRVCRQCGRERANEKRRRFRESNPIVRKLNATCSKGHPYTPENTYTLSTRPKRRCKICHLENVRNHESSKKGRYK